MSTRMRTRTTLAALAATTLIAVLPTGSAGTAVAAAPTRCAWTLMDTPGYDDYVYSVDAVSSRDVRFFGQTNANTTRVMLDWEGSAVAVSDKQLPALPRFTPSTERQLSYDSAESGWLPMKLASPVPVLMRWTDGRWEPTSAAVSPNPRVTHSTILGMDSLSADEAWAVGSLEGFESGVTGAMVQHWDGTAWRIVDNPAATRPNAMLYDVGVASATDVWAVGQQRNAADKIVPLIVHWDGTEWSEVPAPDGQSGWLNSVSATITGDVWTVGNAGPEYTDFANLAMHYDGERWQTWTASTGLPDVGLSQLESVVATAPDDVWAVMTNLEVSQEDILHWDGTRWETVTPHGAQPPGAQLNYLDVDATGRGDVWAVGGQVNSTVGGLNVPTEALVAHLSCGRR